MDSLAKINKHSHSEISQGTDTIKKLISLIANTYDAFKKITSVTHLIQNIAKQTNLLSLNASIEAARAGSAGAGFAIVAENISRLADESLSRVKEIDASIQITQSSIDQAVVATGIVEKLFSMLLLNSEKSEQQVSEFKVNMHNQNQLITEILNEVRDFQSIASLLEQGLQTERGVIDSVMQEIQIIAGKSVETNENAIKVKEKITELVKNTEKVNNSLSYFSLKED